MADDSAEAALELTILSTDGLSGSASALLRRARPFAVVWVDPALKRTAKSLSTAPTLHFPLSPQALRDSGSCVTVQILSSRAPFARPKLVGSAELPLASVPAAAGEALELPLYRPSGRARGSLRVSARILWCLGPAPAAGCVTEVPVMDAGGELFNVDPTAPPVPHDVMMMSSEIDGPAFLNVSPTAPPVPRDVEMILPEVDRSTFLNTGLTVPPVSGDVGVGPVETEESGRKVVPSRDNVKTRPERGNAVRSFLVGLLSGAVAAVVVGAAGLAEG